MKEAADSSKNEISSDIKKEQNCQESRLQDILHSSTEATNTQENEAAKTGEINRSRRRKGASKPRKIRQGDCEVELESSQPEHKRKSLDSLLQRVLKAKQAEEPFSGSTAKENLKKMIDVHETLAIRHNHSPKSVVQVSTNSPGSAGSPASLYSNDRQEDNLSDNGCQGDPFVKIRPRSNGNISPEVAPPHETPMQRSLSSDAVPVKRSLSPVQVGSPKEQESQFFSSSSPSLSTATYFNGNHASAIAVMAAGMGLPTMIPSNAVMTTSIPPLVAMQHQQQFRRESNEFSDTKTTPKQNAPQNENSYSIAGRGIVGSGSGSSRAPASPPLKDRSQYKRPPHTYPALIASAILDSPGHLITLRGIYEYIMNNFPYYKYCHDKSAWQNSIRHNLSLNQCFVKVPRYENAAKSNYWTMTREGFEEFGNENSFKRRRRRGAALAPISAYKAKKYQYEGGKGNNKNKTDSRRQSSENTPVSNPVTPEGYGVPFPPHLMGLARAWGPSFRANDARLKSRKRSQSPIHEKEAKHSRLLVLKQGDGPTLGGIQSEEPKRPNSLSSVEEMQGSLKYFLDASGKMDGPSPLLSTGSQQWMAAAQKNLMATPGNIMPSLLNGNQPLKSPERTPLNSSSDASYGNRSPVMTEGIEIGNEVVYRYDDAILHQFCCGFCQYTYVGASCSLLEQHVRLLHRVEMANAKTKALVRAQSERMAVKSNEAAKQLLSLQSMVSGLSPRSMVAAAHSNAQSLLAAAQASVTTSPATTFPYSATFSSALLDDSVMRSLAEHVVTGQTSAPVSADPRIALPSMDAYSYQRQEALNSALQQVAAASSTATASQDQLRMIYQQLASIHSPFMANTANKALATAFPRQMSPVEADQSNQFKQQFWQYQQNLISQMKALSDETTRNEPAPSRRNSQNEDTNVANLQTSPCRSPTQSGVDQKKSIHGWKQCSLCQFTAKGEHGLELHYRKTHSHIDGVTSPGENSAVDVTTGGRRSPNLAASENELNKEINSIHKSTAAFDAKYNETCQSPSSVFPTPPLSNSPSYVKRHFSPLDLSGAKAEDEMAASPGAVASASTQTCESVIDPTENRTCNHCNIMFGDEMMYALHMSCHDKVDPFKCTICGQKCNEKYYFNVHVLRGLHQTSNGSDDDSVANLKVERAENEFSSNAVATSYRRHSNSSDTSSVSSHGRLNSDAGEIAACH